MHAERGAGTSDGGWRVAVAVDVQVGGSSHQDRMWVASANYRNSMLNGYGCGDGSTEGEKNYL